MIECSARLAVREMNIRATRRQHHSTPSSTAKITGEETGESRQDVAQAQPSPTVGENMKCYHCFSKHSVFMKLCVSHSLEPALPHLGFPQEKSRHVSTESVVERAFKAALFRIVNTANSSNAPYRMNGRQTVVRSRQGVPLSGQRATTSIVLNSESSQRC